MVVVKLRKCTLVWYEDEFVTFLQKNPDFFERGIKNGKWYIRGEKEKERAERDYERIYRSHRG